MNGKLVVSEGGRDRVHELLDEVTVVGRGPAADLRLKDPKAALAHCEVRRTPQGFRLVDLETREGTQVNGRHVNAHILQQGDVVRIGAVELAYLGDAGPSPAPTRAAGRAGSALGKGRAKGPVAGPEGADDAGQKRFYRHEKPARRAADSGAKWLIVLLFVGLGTVVAVAIYRQANDDSKLYFARAAESLFGAMSEERLRDALADLDRIEPGKVDPREIGRVRGEIKERLAGIAGERAAAAEAEAYAAAINLYTASTANGAEVARLCDELLSKYPDTLRRAEIEKLRRRASLGGDPEVAWDRLMAEINAAMRERRWSDAYGAFDRFAAANPAMRREFGPQFDANRRTLADKYEQFVAERFQAAQAAVARGDVAQAKSIYADVAQRNIDPHANAARAALERLK